MEVGKPNLEIFAETLLNLAQANRDILAITSDSRGSGKLGAFGKKLPEQIVEVGIAEQNLVGISAGLASTGKKAFAVSPACFLTARGLEQIKNDVAYSDNPVKLIGISAGVSYGALGSTHHSLHDFAALQAINNLDIVVPADNFETAEAIKAAVSHSRPIYIRFGKKSMPHLHGVDAQFEIGKAIQLVAGDDVTFLAIGEPAAPALQASQLLAGQGVAAGVISVHTLKPLDETAVLAAARRSKAIITVEEHSVYGGLGSTVAALLMDRGVYVPFKAVAIPDEYTVTGSQDEIFAHYGISPEGLAATAQRLLQGMKIQR
ncbi:MAG: transketolase family protein [Ardenticatenaceae bacterium]|nr:transketolase family protein [Ardenticatenaceae bacterium]MCB9445888.1 transketolase family protein [Ardenticatenaceae bacterium]